jgi:hypothetical protein
MTSIRSINETIHSQMESWISTLPDTMQSQVRQGIVVTGGCIVSMLRNEPVNDFDIYFSDPGVAKEVVQHYVDGQGKELRDTHITVEGGPRTRTGPSLYRVYVDASHSSLNRVGSDVGKRERSTIISFSKNNKYEGKSGIYVPLFLTENALTLTNGIQLITRFCGSVETIHETFDYVHARSYWTYTTGLVLRPNAMESILTNELIVNNVDRYPISAMMRMRKFIERGWKINAGEMFKIAFAISKLDLNNVNVLREQLIGVDLLLFVEFLRELDKHKNEQDFVDESTIMNYITEVFDGRTSNFTVKELDPLKVFSESLNVRRRATY